MSASTVHVHARHSAGFASDAHPAVLTAVFPARVYQSCIAAGQQPGWREAE